MREDHVHRRLGHIDELEAMSQREAEVARAREVYTIGGFPMDRFRGLPNCG
jgi:hypothetical protein